MEDNDAKCLEKYRQNRHHLTAWLESIRHFFSHHPILSASSRPIVHSIRARLKDEGHVVRKLGHKAEKGQVIESERFLATMTDLAGLRVLHLYQSEFSHIHSAIEEQLRRGDWVLYEDPVAYTWDPECSDFFTGLGLRTEIKESYYTSIHYVVKPRRDSELCCEIQVRTLFEEAWGEIDHHINYPTKSSVQTCREQLRVLSKLVGAATRLSDSILRSHLEVPAQQASGGLTQV